MKTSTLLMALGMIIAGCSSPSPRVPLSPEKLAEVKAWHDANDPQTDPSFTPRPATPEETAFIKAKVLDYARNPDHISFKNDFRVGQIMIIANGETRKIACGTVIEKKPYIDAVHEMTFYLEFSEPYLVSQWGRSMHFVMNPNMIWKESFSAADKTTCAAYGIIEKSSK